MQLNLCKSFFYPDRDGITVIDGARLFLAASCRMFAFNSFTPGEECQDNANAFGSVFALFTNFPERGSHCIVLKQIRLN